MIIDLRSDTVTKPTKGMLEAMKTADVGDDVFGEDPSVNKLEALGSKMFGMEDALFCPSGTMTNQVAIKCHTNPGDEIICDESSHVYQYEGGGIAFNSGCSVRLQLGDRGRITAKQVLEAINPDDVHKPVSRLVSIENTSNRGGGSCYDFNEIKKIRKVCQDHQLAFHLDGARLFNAIIARKETAIQYGKVFDSISICLSKGLGSPAGSLLLGKKTFIIKARRIRKVFGGGMRQAGYYAAAGIYALENNIKRLKEDHKNATLIGNKLKEKQFVKTVFPVETNIIIFQLDKGFPAPRLVNKFKEKGILCFAMSQDKIRFVTHLDITSEMAAKTAEIIQKL